MSKLSIDGLEGLHRLAKPLNRLSYMMENSKRLSADFVSVVEATYDAAPMGRSKKQTYRLARQRRSQFGHNQRERMLEHAIWRLRGGLDQRNLELGDDVTDIVTYQMPLQRSLRDTIWGKVDLVGLNSSRLPTVIELKDDKSGDTLLRATAEGAAYAIAIRKAWNQDNSTLRDEWTEMLSNESGDVDLPRAIQRVPVIVIAPKKFWTSRIGQPGQREKLRIDPKAWQPFRQLCRQFKNHGLPISFYSIDVDWNSGGEQPTVTGIQKLIWDKSSILKLPKGK